MEFKHYQTALDEPNPDQPTVVKEYFREYTETKNIQIAEATSLLSKNSVLKQEPSWTEQAVDTSTKREEQEPTSFFKRETASQEVISNTGIPETTLMDQQGPTKRRRKQPSKSKINPNLSPSSKLREYERRFREKRQQTETPEEGEARRAKAREAARIKRHQANKIALAQEFKGLLEKTTGTQINAQNSEPAKYARKRRRQATLEKQKEDSRIKSREYNRITRQRQRERETPEEAAARRAKTTAAAKLRRQKASEALLAHIPALQMIQKQAMATTKEEVTKTDEKIVKKNTIRRQDLKQSGIPKIDDKKVAQLLRQKANNKRFVERRKTTETAEQAAARRAKVNEWARRRRQKARENQLKLTAKINSLIGATGASQRAWNKLAKYFLANASENQNAPEVTATKAIVCKQEIDGNSLGCSTSTWSSECSFSTKTESDGYRPFQQNPNETVTIKSEYSQDSWSCYHGSESSFLTQEGIHDTRGLESSTSIEGSKSNAYDVILPGNFYCGLDADVPPDEHSEYGAYIANKFYNANRNKSECNVAQMLIESILLNLLSGVYGYSINCEEANEIGQKEKAPSLPTPAIVKTIVVKKEVDS